MNLGESLSFSKADDNLQIGFSRLLGLEDHGGTSHGQDFVDKFLNGCPTPSVLSRSSLFRPNFVMKRN